MTDDTKGNARAMAQAILDGNEEVAVALADWIVEFLKTGKKTTTPEEFRKHMEDIFSGNRDTESAHGDGDRTMMDTLRELGYGAGVEIFDNADKWYA